MLQLTIRGVQDNVDQWIKTCRKTSIKKRSATGSGIKIIEN